MKIARLDANSLIVAIEPHPGRDLTPVEIEVPDDTDLVAACAHWDAERGHFVFVNRPFGSAAAPHDELRTKTLDAIAEALLSMRDGKPLTQLTLDWLKWYEASFDKQGT